MSEKGPDTAMWGIAVALAALAFVACFVVLGLLT